MVTAAQKKRQERMAATIAARQEQAKLAVVPAEVESPEPGIGRPSWVNEAEQKLIDGDGSWVKLGEHLTRQSAEHGRARLRRKLRAEGKQDEYELWVTVDRAQISKELLRKGDRAMKAAVEQELPRPKMRRPAAVFGRWVAGSAQPEVVQQRVAGRAGGAATREANTLRRQQIEAAGRKRGKVIGAIG